MVIHFKWHEITRKCLKYYSDRQIRDKGVIEILKITHMYTYTGFFSCTSKNYVLEPKCTYHNYTSIENGRFWLIDRRGLFYGRPPLGPKTQPEPSLVLTSTLVASYAKHGLALTGSCSLACRVIVVHVRSGFRFSSGLFSICVFQYGGLPQFSIESKISKLSK